MIRYSSVLIPTSFMWWIINSSDKAMIACFIGNDATGIYAISYKLPSLLTTVASIFNQAWVFSAINEKDSNDYEKYTNGVFNSLFGILSLSAVVLLGMLKIIFSIYVSPEYYSAWQYVPFLVLGYIFMTMGTFVSTSYNVHKDSKGFLFSGSFGAICNVILNILLIPLFGIYGAAIATMCSYIVVFIYRIFDTKKYLKIKIKITHVVVLGIVIGSVIITYFNTYFNIIYMIVAISIIVYIYRKVLKEALKRVTNHTKTNIVRKKK